jgi:hypothetical protein
LRISNLMRRLRSFWMCLKLCTLMVIRDVATWWNYTHDMIRRAIMLCEVC